MPERLTLRGAIADALLQEMRDDPDLIVIGEIVATSGGIARVTTGLVHEFGPQRVVETPVSENMIVGAGLGGALAGRHMVVEVFAADMLFAAGSEVINDIAKWRYQHRWERPIQLVLRMPMGVGQLFAGPEHSQCIEGYLLRTAGLTVVAPGTPWDAGDLLRAAIRLGDPVVFLEHRRLYDLAVTPPAGHGDVAASIGTACVARAGDAITVVAWSWMRTLAEQAAAEVAADGIEVEIIDPRTLKPLDFDMIITSVAKTGALLVVEEAPRSGCVGDSIIARTVLEVDLPRGRANVLTMPDVPLPFDDRLAYQVVPTVEQIKAEIARMVSASPVVVGR